MKSSLVNLYHSFDKLTQLKIKCVDKDKNRMNFAISNNFEKYDDIETLACLFNKCSTK